jgi:hypothetical protein
MKNKINFNTLLPVEILFILLISATVYLANGVAISSGDTVPNTLLAFNWLENYTLNLDAFRGSYLAPSTPLPYYFVEANNGHLSSGYPIGTALVTFPLYVIFYIYIKLTYFFNGFATIDLTSVDFETYRVFFEKLAATIVTAASVAIFYLLSRLKFPLVISLVSTFTFAFATNTWVTSSQGLWQHGTSNLVFLITISCLMKANRASKTNQKIWLVLAGVACGLLPGIRPTSTLFSVTVIIYSLVIYRFQAIFLCIGLVSAIPSIAWNIYYFGNLTGGYSKVFSVSPYLFTWNNFIRASLGTLISPSRGLLIFSPIVLYSLPGACKVWKLRFSKDEKLIGSLSIACILLTSSYFFYIVWSGGHCYGPRFMTDIMPVACYLINYYLESLFTIFIRAKHLLARRFIIFLAILTFSTFTQVVGAFGAIPGILWNIIPIPIDHNNHEYRLWELRDSQIERNAKAVFHKIIKPSTDTSIYVHHLSGKIKQVTDENNQPLGAVISVEPGSQKVLKAEIENTGSSQWYGYESAIEKGEVRVRGRFYNNGT